MEGDFKYLEYVGDGSIYYEKQKPREKMPFEIMDIPHNWLKNTDDDFWTMYYIPDQEMIVQGFKVHVSTAYAEASETLAIVADILFSKNIPFKHVKDKESLFNMYSKHGSRIQAGKFITIYPHPDEFIPIMDALVASLEHSSKSPHILTDRRYKNSNVFYRYGAFENIQNEEGVSCILNPKGELIPDLREPRFYLPEFATIPSKIIDEDKKLAETFPTEPSRLKLYNIEKVIRFSNAGGIYVGSRKEDDKKVVIKEARKQIGLDGQARNAEYRLGVEYEALKKLEGVSGVVQVVDYFSVWENTFLVIEFVEGVPLYSWMAQNYPFAESADTKEYFNNVVSIVKNLENIINDMNARGVAMCDIQTQNVMIDENLCVNIIDFETAENADDESVPALATRGFANMLNTKAKDRDWYSLNRIFQFLMLPIGGVYDIDMSVNIGHLIWIYNNFRKDEFDYF